MPAPYTIEQTAEASGLSVKFIRRMKSALPELFSKHTERGQSNALLFDEEIIEVLKRTKQMKNRGRTLQQIRDELAALAGKEGESEEPKQEAISKEEKISDDPLKQALDRENLLLRSQVNLLQTLLKKSEERFDRLLPAATEKESPKAGFKTQMVMWLVEAVVVTAFAAGFIFLIWLFAQKAFTL